MRTFDTVTIISDASYDFDSKVSGFAFVIYNGDFMIKDSGTCHGMTSSTEAEGAAITNAIYTFIKSGIKAKKLYIYIDNMPFLSQVKKGKINKITTVLLELLEQIGPHQFRHLKGHTKGLSTEVQYHNWCDNRSRTRMMDYRDETQMLGIK